MDESKTNMLSVGKRPATRRSRVVIAAALFGTLCLFLLYRTDFLASRPQADSWMPTSQEELVKTGNKLVPLEAHIMSKCPDARVGLAQHLARYAGPARD